jgi:hypothetical protein
MDFRREEKVKTVHSHSSQFSFLFLHASCLRSLLVTIIEFSFTRSGFPLNQGAMLAPLEFTIILDDTSKRKACDLLASRLASSKLTKDNLQLIAKLLGFSKGEMHCHHSGRPLAHKEREAYCCAIGTVAGCRVVVAACFRHVERPRRASASQRNFTELLLLAVDRNEERKGLGRSMVEYVHDCARAVGSEQLIVVSNGHDYFWRHPGLRFVDLEPNHGLNVFVPWSEGIKLLVRCIEAAGPEASIVEAKE